MSSGKPGTRPGIPSPFKKYWIIDIKGALVRFEGFGINQFPKGPTPFEDKKQAINAARHIWVGETHYVVLHHVTRKWLESVAKGEITPQVQTYVPESPIRH